MMCKISVWLDPIVAHDYLKPYLTTTSSTVSCREDPRVDSSSLVEMHQIRSYVIDHAQPVLLLCCQVSIDCHEPKSLVKSWRKKVAHKDISIDRLEVNLVAGPRFSESRGHEKGHSFGTRRDRDRSRHRRRERDGARRRSRSRSGSRCHRNNHGRDRY